MFSTEIQNAFCKRREKGVEVLAGKRPLMPKRELFTVYYFGKFSHTSRISTIKPAVLFKFW